MKCSSGEVFTRLGKRLANGSLRKLLARAPAFSFHDVRRRLSSSQDFHEILSLQPHRCLLCGFFLVFPVMNEPASCAALGPANDSRVSVLLETVPLLHLSPPGKHVTPPALNMSRSLTGSVDCLLGFKRGWGLGGG